MTAHRAQGQTWKNQLISVNLGLESPSSHIPGEIASVLYVACTRTNKLQNLFVSPIFPTIWERIGKSEVDEARRKTEERLKENAERFAQQHGWHEEYVEEQSYVPDYSENAREWEEIVGASAAPVILEGTEVVDDGASHSRVVGEEVPEWLTPCESERHIGVDQGVKNWAMVAVDKTADAVRVVGVKLYNLAKEGLRGKKFDEADLLSVLMSKTVLMSWMQQEGYPQLLPPVDRVVVHLEQVSAKNKFSKLFNAKLGQLLQQRVNHIQTCIVKMSQPHIHRASGPMFKLGDRIVKECELTPAVYTYTSRTASKRPADAARMPPLPKQPRVQRSACPSDVSLIAKARRECRQQSVPQTKGRGKTRSIGGRRKCRALYFTISYMPTWTERRT